MAVGLVLLGALVACATTSAPSGEAAAKPSVLADVQVVNEGPRTRVRLAGVSDADFRAFQQQDPARLVLDLPGVVPGEVEERLAVGDGTLDEVRIESYADAGDVRSTRVELALATVAEHEIRPVGDALEVRVTAADTAPLDEPEALEAEEIDDPWAWHPAPEAQDAAGEEAGDARAVAASEEGADEAAKAPAAAGAAPEAEDGEAAQAPLARHLVDVIAEPAGSGVRLALRGDGSIDGARAFHLEDPVRLVIDLPGLVNRFPEARVALEAGPARQLRIGQHEDKVRIVLDAAEGVERIEPARLEPGPEGLQVALGEVVSEPGAAASVAEAKPAAEAASAADTPEPAEGERQDGSAELAQAPEATGSASGAESTSGSGAESGSETEAMQPAPAAEPQLSRVQGVQLDAQAGRDRITVLTEGAARYETLELDDGTLMVRFPEATIDPEAEVNLAPRDPQVVSLVTAFEQPELATPEVRVVIRRADGATPEIHQEGTMLFVDFPHEGALAKAVPAVTESEAAAVEARASQKAMAQTADAASAPPAAIEPDQDGLEILQEGGLVDGKQYTGRRISLDFKNVDIDDVLRLIAEVSDLNIIAGEEVSGKVTIRLVDVPWDQALDVILLTKGLGFIRVGNVLRIAPADVIAAEEEARLQEKRAKEKLEDLVVKLQPVNYADVGEVSKMVKRLLTPRGSVDVDNRTNTIILKDIASVIDEATALIKAIDTQTPQVMIEAKIVEANLDFLRELGSKWALGVQPRVDAFDESSGMREDEGGEDFRFRNNQNPVLNGLTNANNVAVANPITELATGVVNLGAFILDERFDVDIQLEAAESHGEGKIISSPRVVTLDNREASIEQGVSIPFQTFENGDAKLEFIDAVLSLEVTPHITADRSIIMQIQVQRNAPDPSVNTPTGSPAIAKNEAETETLVKDGQTLVIGGIYTVEKTENQSRVPYLHKIPILGAAFKNNSARDRRQELLVFVTPRIVQNPELGL